MTPSFLNWWHGRSPREQRLLAVMAALFVIVLVWLGVLRPLAAAREAAEARHAGAVTALGQVREVGARLAAAHGRPTLPIDEPLVAYLGRSAGEAGLPVERLEAQGSDRAVLTVIAARPAAVFGWIQRIEVRDGLLVERLSATRNPDTTIAVQATFRRPAR
jgi:general secretion pathway protein M